VINLFKIFKYTPRHNLKAPQLVLKLVPKFNLGIGKAVALDWGSRYCYVWSAKNGFKSYLSNVWIDDKGNVKAWGNANQASLVRFKSQALIKNGYLTDFKMCVAFIKNLLGDNLNKIEMIKPTAWIAVNTSAHQSETEGLEYVLTQAGFGKIYFVNQNLALAVHHNFDFGETKTQTMLHFGQQQTLISTISQGGFIQQKAHNFGAQNIDTIIENYIRNVYRLSVSSSDIENLKSLLNPYKPKSQIWGRDLLSDRIKNVELDYGEIWNQVKPVIDSLTDLIKDYIQSLPDEIINDLVDNGILISGGGVMFGRILEYLQIKLNINLFIDSEPKQAIISGLAKIMTHQEEYLSSDFVWGEKK
jgi:rod shape-determining protein MreB